MSKVYIVLVNWNGWADTLECLESLLGLDYPEFRIIIVDNASTDGSCDYIRRWVNNQYNLIQVGPRRDISPSRNRSISFVEYNRNEAESGGDPFVDVLLTLLHSSANLGFAGGNNVGLRFILARDDADHIWLLNNDTFVESHALTALVERVRAKPGVGMCGSSLLFYERPEMVQALGGAYFCPWFAVAWHLGQRRPFSMPEDPLQAERFLSYIVGASMLVSMEFVRKVGLMTEDYFLYFEEIDWTLRADKRFSLAYAPDSLVYHKVGKSIGTRSHPARKSLICDYYNIRNRLVFTRRFYPWALPTVCLGLFVEALVRLCCGRMRRAVMIFRLMASWRNPPPLSSFK